MTSFAAFTAEPLAGHRALLFDLDGVVTNTATVHSAAWKALFDEFLREWSEEHDEAFREFTIDDDYVRYVDGMRRHDGVRRFLASRDIELPEGDPSDGPEARTVQGLGSRKDAAFLHTLARDGVEVFEDAVALLDACADVGCGLAVVSASENADGVLERVGLLDRFHVRVTGREAKARNLAGKPAPDTFLAAAELLGVEPARAVVLEDAVSGIEAGVAGGFGLVVGVDHGDNGAALAAAGAHRVDADLRALLAG